MQGPSSTRAGRRQSGQPTIADVARLAGCSPMTVSRVINGEGGVRAPTRTRVEAAIARLGYAPNRAARLLAGAVQTRIALLYENPSASYLSELLLGSLEQARSQDAWLVVERCDGGESPQAAIERLLAAGVDGFLLPAPICEDEDLLAMLRRQGTRAVQVSAGVASPSHSAVIVDEFGAAREMTDHILALGHRRIGFIAGSPRHAASARRREGFLAAMAGAGIVVEEDLVAEGDFTYRSGLAAAARLLDRAEPPTAIFASNDEMAAAVVAVAHRRQMDVPADLTVCGFDDIAIASTIWPELTTIRQPIAEMGRRAVDLLVAELRAARAGKDPAPTHVVAAHELVRRQSDGPPRAAG